jgi:dipeptidyl-peptidase III
VQRTTWLYAVMLALGFSGCGPEPLPKRLQGSSSARTAPPSAVASGKTAAPPGGSAAKTSRPAPGATLPVLAEVVEDHQVLRYRIDGFDSLSLPEKQLAYYLYEAALSGRDIVYDQKFKYNLAIRKTLEAIVSSYPDKQDKAYQAILMYAKQVWMARGIHHDYSSQKFVPAFTKEDLVKLIEGSDKKLLPLSPPPGSEGSFTPQALAEALTPLLFDPKVAPINVTREKGKDLIVASANNFYEGVTQKEVEEFYKGKADPKSEREVMWGLNSKLVKEGDQIVEKVWKVGGMYGPAIEKIVFWLEKAAGVAESPAQKDALDKLIAYYKSGKLEDFDAYSVAWVKDTQSRFDTINGFIETYGDAVDKRGTWEAVVQMRDEKRTERIAKIAGAAQWFEDNSPIADKHKKKEVKGISARVITVIVEGGDAAPTTPVGINLPNSDWIRKEHGSKSVFLGNIVDAYSEVAKESGVVEEFSLTPEEVARAKEHGTVGYALKVDMHECIGHASGQLEEDVKDGALKEMGSALEEARADLVALYYVMDPKLIELGVMKSLDVGKSAYDGYIQNGLLVQLARIKLGDDLVQSHMRNRQMVSSWAFDKGKKDNVIERVEKDGKIYFVIRDYDKLRKLWGELLREVQRIKSTGDYAAGKKLIETYGIKIDRDVHENVLTRYNKLGAKPFSGFIQPKLVPVEESGKIVDVLVEYPADFAEQQLEYGRDYAFLPTYN